MFGSYRGVPVQRSSRTGGGFSRWGTSVSRSGGWKALNANGNKWHPTSRAIQQSHKLPLRIGRLTAAYRQPHADDVDSDSEEEDDEAEDEQETGEGEEQRAESKEQIEQSIGESCSKRTDRPQSGGRRTLPSASPTDDGSAIASWTSSSSAASAVPIMPTTLRNHHHHHGSRGPRGSSTTPSSHRGEGTFCRASSGCPRGGSTRRCSCALHHHPPRWIPPPRPLMIMPTTMTISSSPPRGRIVGAHSRYCWNTRMVPIGGRCIWCRW
mmetsp:Transcript_29927/g.72294  ORF Transcript_29927/g.72294 Transcript_29927/m.72294 type:complete len:267 (-) Transcript_29927:249-1049(-)